MRNGRPQGVRSHRPHRRLFHPAAVRRPLDSADGTRSPAADRAATVPGRECRAACPCVPARAGSSISIRVYGCRGARDDLGDRRDLHQPSGIHDAEPIDELRHQPHVVADQDDRGAQVLLHPAERLHDLALHHDIERTGRLVGDDHLGPQADGDGDAGALLHPAGQVRAGISPPASGGRPDLRQQRRTRSCSSRRDSACHDRRIASPIWSRMRTTGFSEFIDPCGTMAMPASRSRRIASSRQVARVRCPPARPSPPSMRPGGLIMRRIASAMVDLPEPDSPARPNRSSGTQSEATHRPPRAPRPADASIGRRAVLRRAAASLIRRTPQPGIGDLVQPDGQEEQPEEHHHDHHQRRRPPPPPAVDDRGVEVHPIQRHAERRRFDRAQDRAPPARPTQGWRRTRC